MRYGLAAVLLLAASPLAAQQAAAARDWRVRVDRPGADTAGVFTPMAPGWHITSGRTSAIYWDPALSASGAYTIEAEIFFFREQSRDTEGYGLLLGGKDLDGEAQDYFYILLRNDGKYCLKHRAGNQVHTITDWTAHDAILRHTPETQGQTVKNLMVVAVTDSLRLSVNGTPLATYPVRPQGLVGLRVNHGLNLHVARLVVR